MISPSLFLRCSETIKCKKVAIDRHFSNYLILCNCHFYLLFILFITN
nr:MAG TPA: hypothetical protein [Caudoviricetes sp.]